MSEIIIEKAEKIKSNEIDKNDYYNVQKNLPNEEWVELVFGKKLYELSNYGRLKSFYFNKKGTILKNQSAAKYLKLEIKVEGKQKNIYIHKLVAEYFIPNEEHKKSVIHLDNDCKNNHFENLKWVDSKELFTHTKKFNPNFNKVFSKKLRRNTILTKRQIININKKIAKGISIEELTKQYKVSEIQITEIKQNENWVIKDN